jgi:putative methionine-R-sulfoxide reductase with GAF domain
VRELLPVAKKIVPEDKHKPVLDEQTFAKLLEAAYVLQEHNLELQKLELKFDRQKDRLGAQAPPVSIPPRGEPQTQDAEPPSWVAASVESGPAGLTPPPEELAAAGLRGAEPARAEIPPRDDYTFTLAQIVETQHQIQVRHLELENAMSLVAERVTEIAKAGGAAVCFQSGKTVRYRGVAGLMTLPLGTEVPLEKALCVACLKTGHAIRCPDVNTEFLLDPAECHRRGIQAMIAVPVFHEEAIAGGLELYYAKARAFTEQDVHTCQLMAGLITEALAREVEVTPKKSLASERAVLLEALERLKPNLAALLDNAALKSAASRGAESQSAGAPATSPATASSALIFACRKCGHQLVGEEQFCGKCGSPRSGDYAPPSMHSKVAALWHGQEAMRKDLGPPAANGDPGKAPDPARPEKPLADSIEEEMPELFATPEVRVSKMSKLKMADPELSHQAVSSPIEDPVRPDLSVPSEVSPDDGFGDDRPAETALAKREPVANWSSAMTAREFLEQLALAKNPGALATFWKARRGDIYLAIAVILVAAVIRWGIWSNHSVSATGAPAAAAASHRKPPPDADLSLFDRMLIGLGLAEAPPAPEYKGNPETQVWVDLHTALYYCPGADLYGKTPKGRFASQREAQLDQFEPAYRKACD